MEEKSNPRGIHIRPVLTFLRYGDRTLSLSVSSSHSNYTTAASSVSKKNKGAPKERKLQIFGVLFEECNNLASESRQR